MKNMMRWNKFQDRAIGKLVKEVKSLKKKLAKVASCASCSTSRNTKLDVMAPEEGQSSKAEPRRSARRPRRYIASPPCPESDNESPPFFSDDEELSTRRGATIQSFGPRLKRLDQEPSRRRRAPPSVQGVVLRSRLNHI
ncbi:unnamed protein product [Cochlearia groenlandica]